MAPKRALVVVPTYNEAGSIREVIARLSDATAGTVDLLVVDDSSPDGTAAIVEDVSDTRDDVFLLQRPRKTGLGDAYKEGFRWGIERGYPALVEMDADLSHDPAIVPLLLDALDAGADLAIGSRYVPGGRVENWGSFRRLLSRSGNAYARILLRMDVQDSTAGFRAFKTEWLKTQDLSSVSSHGYAFQIEMTRRAALNGGRIVEIPITFVERTTGRSKMSKRIVMEALTGVTVWGIKDRLTRKR